MQEQETDTNMRTCTTVAEERLASGAREQLLMSVCVPMPTDGAGSSTLTVTLSPPSMALPAAASTSTRARAPKKKVAPRAVYKTSSACPDPLGSTSEDETIIMRLNVCTRDLQTLQQLSNHKTEPHAYNAAEALSLVGTPLHPEVIAGQGAPLEHSDFSMGLCPMTDCCPGAVFGAATLEGGSVISDPSTADRPDTRTLSMKEENKGAQGAGIGPDKGMRVVQLLAEFDQKSRNSEWPSMTSINCYWCCHGFQCAPVGLPLRRSGDVFHVMGCFCSLECSAAYNFGMPRVSVDRALERFMLINSLAGKLGVGGGAIKPAPDRLALAMFGGPLSIDEFRDYRSTQRHVIINQPPMLTLMQQVEEVDERDMKSAYSYIPLDVARVEKFQEKVRLRRIRPLVDPKNTLDQCMKLRYGPDTKARGV